MSWVLQQVGDVLHGWYWCGGGNPMFQTAYEATKYKTKKDAQLNAAWLNSEGIGTFAVRRYTPKDPNKWLRKVTRCTKPLMT